VGRGRPGNEARLGAQKVIQTSNQMNTKNAHMSKSPHILLSSMILDSTEFTQMMDESGYGIYDRYFFYRVNPTSVNTVMLVSGCCSI
jgi:hypothetical protein